MTRLEQVVALAAIIRNGRSTVHDTRSAVRLAADLLRDPAVRHHAEWIVNDALQLQDAMSIDGAEF